MTVRAAMYLLLGAFLLAIVMVAGVKRREYESKIRELQADAAAHAITVKLQNGVFEKTDQDRKDLKKLLDTRDDEQKRLKQELDKSKSQVLTLTTVNLTLQKKLQSAGKATQTDVGGGRIKVDFDRNMGSFRVYGYTLTNPGEAFLTMEQLLPLRLTLSLSKGKQGWQTLISAADKDLKVDVGVTAVDSSVLARRWYEALGLIATVAAGTKNALFGVGATYDFNRFSLGPMVWLSTSGERVYGLTLTWRPFFSTSR